MNRRKFTALIAAGAVFPLDLLKAFGRSNERRVQGTRWYCFGTNDEPTDSDDLEQLHECLLGEREWTHRLYDIPRTAYHVTIPPKRWVIGLGNDDRPAYAEDLESVKSQFEDQLQTDWRELTVVTHFNTIPYEFMGCTLHDPPMVISHNRVPGWLKVGKIRKISPKLSRTFGLMSSY